MKMIIEAEEFRCVTTEGGIKCFDDFRYSLFHKNSHQLDLEKLPCISETIKFHIRQGYSQSYKWYNSADAQFTDIISDEHGYRLEIEDGGEDDDGYLVPTITRSDILMLTDISQPCKCNKCARNLSL